MNNEDANLLEDFLNYLATNQINPDDLDNAGISETVSQFMSSGNYIPRPIEVISTTNIPSPHFNIPKITL